METWVRRRGVLALGASDTVHGCRIFSIPSGMRSRTVRRSPGAGRLGRQAGAEKLGASLFELPPGRSSFPLHVHHANEELIVIVAGRPTLRTLDSEWILEPGEVVACPTGRRGAHRLGNRSN